MDPNERAFVADLIRLSSVNFASATEPVWGFNQQMSNAPLLETIEERKYCFDVEITISILTIHRRRSHNSVSDTSFRIRSRRFEPATVPAARVDAE